MVKDDSFGPTPSRGFSIRHLSLQHINKLPLVMLTLEHEEGDHKGEHVCFAPQGNTPVLESFTVFNIGRKVFHVAVALMHGTRNHLVRKGGYFNKPVNGFV